VSMLLLLIFSSVALQGGMIDITSDCGGPCTSITYSGAPGAPGATPTGAAYPITINGIWATLADVGMAGQWISYAQTGLTGTGPLAGQIVNFTVDYSIDPLFKIASVTLNVMADDFAQLVGSPQNFGPLPAWTAVDIPGHYCSQNPPGCLPTTLYTDTLSQSGINMFANDHQLVFSVLQLVDNTPFGLAFDIQISGTPITIPEPGSLSLLVLGIAAASAVQWRRRRL
jgi:PEP-CTERM motif